MTDSLAELTQATSAFARERDWGRFHTPKNLAMALAGEVGELVAELQWLTDDEVQAALAQGDLRARVSDELADVLLYLLQFAEACEIDLLAAGRDKLKVNEQRYPVSAFRGNAKKYDTL